MPKTMLPSASLTVLLAVGQVSCSGPSVEPGRGQPQPPPVPQLVDPEARVLEQISAADTRLAQLSRDDSTTLAELCLAWRELGETYLSYELHEAALACFGGALHQDPRDFRSLYLTGHLHMLAGRPAEAVTAFTAAAGERPDHVPSLIRLARAELADGDPASAARHFLRAKELDPASAAAHEGLGNVALAGEQPAEAVGHLERALELQPDASSLRHLLATALRRLGRTEEAERFLAAAGDAPVLLADPILESVASRSLSVTSYRIRAAEAMARRRFEAAAGLLHRALEIDASDHRVHWDLATCLEAMGAAEAAENRLQQGLAVTPEDAVEDRVAMLSQLAGLEMADDDLRGAEEALTEALRLAPNRVEMRLKMAGLTAATGRFAVAADSYRQILEDDPGSDAAVAGLAACLMNLGRRDEGVALLESAVASDPQDAGLRIRLAEAMAFAGEAEAAHEQLRRALELAHTDAERVEVHRQSALHAIRLSDFAAAVASCRLGLDLAPGDVDTLMLLGSVHGHLGQWGEAVAAFEVVLAQDPTHAAAHRSRIIALVVSERWLDAREAIESAIAARPSDRDLAHALARVCAIAPEAAARDGTVAVGIAQRIHQRQLDDTSAATLAMALAEEGRFEEAMALEARIVAGGGRAGAAAQRRLDGYRSRRPWRARSPDEVIQGTLVAVEAPG